MEISGKKFQHFLAHIYSGEGHKSLHHNSKRFQSNRTKSASGGKIPPNCNIRVNLPHCAIVTEIIMGKKTKTKKNQKVSKVCLMVAADKPWSQWIILNNVSLEPWAKERVSYGWWERRFNRHSRNDGRRRWRFRGWVRLTEWGRTLIPETGWSISKGMIVNDWDDWEWLEMRSECRQQAEQRRDGAVIKVWWQVARTLWEQSVFNAFSYLEPV